MTNDLLEIRNEEVANVITTSSVEIAEAFVPAGIIGVEALETTFEKISIGSDFDIEKSKPKRATDFETRKLEDKKEPFQPSIRNIHLDKIEYVYANDVLISAEEGRALIESIKKDDVVDFSIDTVKVFTDRYNYLIIFTNAQIEDEKGEMHNHQVFYTKTCSNFEIVNGKVVRPKILNPERIVALVRGNKIVTSISEERMLKRVLKLDYIPSDEQPIGADEYLYHAGTNQFVVINDTFDNVFFAKRNNVAPKKSDVQYIPKVSDYAIHLIENGEYVVRFGKQETPGGKVVYTGVGTRGEAERSYKNFAAAVVTN